jgi:hypothetical protein
LNHEQGSCARAKKRERLLDRPDKESLKSVFQIQSAAHKKAREDFLDNAITTAAEWIGNLTDPELGDIGRQFLDLAEKSGCKQKIDIFFTSCLADYCSFSYNPRGFVNQITYGPGAEESLARLFSAKVHETTHALQKMNSAALHASPFNPDTKIIICPRDWVMLEERCEQDSYTKQAYFNSLLAQFLPEVLETTRWDALSVDDFTKIRDAASGIGEALIEAARQSLAKSFYSDNPASEYRFKNSIQDQALKNYEAGIVKRRSCGESGWKFVRLEPEDIAAIGASCGPNIFGRNGVLPEFLEQPAMLAKTKEKLAELDKSCGITNADQLPTLSEALKEIGLTREQFVAQAYQKSLSRPAGGNGAPAGPASR